jgi:hypothetical protein
MRSILFAAALAALLTVSAFGQSVTITPKKQIYHRPKPMDAYKKTFSIRRPIAKASTPELSRKITAAIDPVTVLDIKLKDEMTDPQWLEEADYKVLYNQKGILSMELFMDGTAAYPSGSSTHVVVNLTTGNRARPADVFTDLAGLARIVKRMQTAEVKAATAKFKKDPDLSDTDPKQLFEFTNYTTKELADYSVGNSGVTFYYDYGFPHVLEGKQPDGTFLLTWAELKPYIRHDGLLARFIR